MEYTVSQRCQVFLAALRGMTPAKYRRILSEAELPENVYGMPEEFRHLMDDKLYRELIDSKEDGGWERLFEQLDTLHLCALTYGAEGYPRRLENISDPPVALFVLGETRLDDDKTFAVVGTRRPTYDGKKAAAMMTEGLAQNGVTVISGLAMGIDAAAHTACVKNGSKTIAVLGNGLAGIYPKQNEALARQITDGGGSIVSEFAPDLAPAKWTFPARNRIIAGLSDGVLVVEGTRKSGSLITASLALEESREVFAVPGSIFNPNAEGPNSLIRSGASPVLSVDDILEGMRWYPVCKRKSSVSAPPELDENEKKIYTLLKNEAFSFNELENLTGISTAGLNYLLTTMELRGIIIKMPGNLFRLK